MKPTLSKDDLHKLSEIEVTRATLWPWDGTANVINKL